MSFRTFFAQIGWEMRMKSWNQVRLLNINSILDTTFLNSRTDKDFLEDFLGVLRNGTDFEEYYFECPPINRDTYNDKSYPFEFVLMKSEGMFKNSISMLIGR